MVKSISLIFCLFAILVSVQADPMLYSFEGTISSANGVVTTFDVTYNILVDFDEVALKGGAAEYDNSGLYSSYDYGSAVISDNTLTYFDIDEIVYANDAYAVNVAENSHYDNEIKFSSTDYILDMPYSEIRIWNAEIQDYGIGDVFLVTEHRNINNNFNHAMGTVTLVSILDPNQQSVPEPNTLMLIVTSSFFLIGLGYKRRKS